MTPEANPKKCKHDGSIGWIRPSWGSFKPRIAVLFCGKCNRQFPIKFTTIEGATKENEFHR